MKDIGRKRLIKKYSALQPDIVLSIIFSSIGFPGFFYKYTPLVFTLSYPYRELILVKTEYD